LIIEGFGSGSGWPKNLRILRISTLKLLTKKAACDFRKIKNAYDIYLSASYYELTMEKSTNDREGNYEKVSMRNSIIRREIIELSKKFTFKYPHKRFQKFLISISALKKSIDTIL
jgi:hypothetical protein